MLLKLKYESKKKYKGTKKQSPKQVLTSAYVFYCMASFGSMVFRISIGNLGSFQNLKVITQNRNIQHTINFRFCYDLRGVLLKPQTDFQIN